MRSETGVELSAEFNRALEAQRRESVTQIGELKQRMETAVGKLPVARAWMSDTVTYQGSFVVSEGSAWQAAKDTAQEPGGPDWLLIAKGGVDGRDGDSLRLRGAYHVDDKYEHLNVVEFQGDVYIARRDGAGLCPGADWLRLSARGEKGDRGERGRRGSRGERGPVDKTLTIDGWTVDAARYRAIPKLSNSTVGAAVELRELFAQFGRETGVADG
jgi:hypothetical protein